MPNYRELYEQERGTAENLREELRLSVEAIELLWEALQFAVTHMKLNVDLIEQYESILDKSSVYLTHKTQ